MIAIVNYFAVKLHLQQQYYSNTLNQLNLNVFEISICQHRSNHLSRPFASTRNTAEGSQQNNIQNSNWKSKIFYYSVDYVRFYDSKLNHCWYWLGFGAIKHQLYRPHRGYSSLRLTNRCIWVHSHVGFLWLKWSHYN